MFQIWHFLSVETRNVTMLTNDYNMKSIGFQYCVFGGESYKNLHKTPLPSEKDDSYPMPHF